MSLKIKAQIEETGKSLITADKWDFKVHRNNIIILINKCEFHHLTMVITMILIVSLNTTIL